MTIKFYLDTKTTKKQGHPLRLYIYNNNKDKKFPFTGYYSMIEDWDFNTEEPKKSHPLYVGIMDFLLENRRKINQILNSRENKTAEEVLNILFKKSSGIYSFWEQRIEELKKTKKDGNAEFYAGYLRSWKNYKQEILFEEIDYNFLTQFKIYKLQNISPNGVNVYLKAMRAIYNEAIKRGVYKPDTFVSPFTNIMEPANSTKDKFLTLDEMKIVASKKIDHEFFRYFMLQFYLGGIDFVDLANIKKEHIRSGRIKFPRFKGHTNELVDNKIFPEAQEILDHFKDDSSEYLLPIHKFSYKRYRDKYVEGLRYILLGAGITSYIDSKTARYSFIHIASKELRLSRDIIKEIVAHANNDTTSIYEGKFPIEMKNEVHQKIIDAILDR